MNWTAGVVVFVLVWWCVLFAVLPWGARSLQETGAALDGAEPGAPSQPRLKLKMLVTTGIAAVVWTAIYLIIRFQVIDLTPESAL